LGQHNLMLAKYRNDTAALDPDCQCRMCQTFTREYLRHLYSTGETLAGRALSYHNLWVVLRLMERIRRSIEAGSFKSDFKAVL